MAALAAVSRSSCPLSDLTASGPARAGANVAGAPPRARPPLAVTGAGCWWLIVVEPSMIAVPTNDVDAGVVDDGAEASGGDGGDGIDDDIEIVVAPSCGAEKSTVGGAPVDVLRGWGKECALVTAQR